MPSERHKITPSVYMVLMRDGKILLARRANTGFMDGVGVCVFVGSIFVTCLRERDVAKFCILFKGFIVMLRVRS